MRRVPSYEQERLPQRNLDANSDGSFWSGAGVYIGVTDSIPGIGGPDEGNCWRGDGRYHSGIRDYCQSYDPADLQVIFCREIQGNSGTDYAISVLRGLSAGI